MGACQDKPDLHQYNFENIYKEDLKEVKINIKTRKQTISPSKNIIVANSKHGPPDQQYEDTEIQSYELPQFIKSKIQQPLNYPTQIRGREEHHPFKCLKTGQIYWGQWTDSKPHGRGHLYNPISKTYYEGTFQENIPSIYGRYVKEDGAFYEGQIKHGRANGQGIYKKDGTLIKGTFRDNQPHGICLQKSSTYIYSGMFENGKWYGKGKLVYDNQKSQYEGSFNNGLFDGFGIHKTPQFTYTGEFKNGKRFGKGTLQTNDGCIYKGQFFKDLPEGQGQLFQNGKGKYFGQWRNGKAHGIGNVNFKSDLLQTGWQNGKAVSFIK